MKIFFSGCIASSAMSGWQRFHALKDLGHQVIPFEQSDFLNRASLKRPLRFMLRRFYDQSVLDAFNRDILEALVRSRPQVAWLEWPMVLSRETLVEAARRLPGCWFVSFQDDNPFGSRAGEHERWRLFLEAIPQYHLHFVKRATDVCEFQRRGAKAVRRFMHGFYEPLFRPIPVESIPEVMRQDVSFVGSPLDHRVGVISELLSRHRLPLRVYGDRWHRTSSYYRHRACFRSAAFGDDYVRVICGSRICLGFVSSSNLDEYSMRTFEVPACKGFFLAERTPTHQELFVEGKEAEFFSSADECADKIRFYLENETVRARVAGQGYRRCVDSGYNLHKRLAEAVDQIQALKT